MPRSMEKALCLGFCEFCHEPHSNNNNVIEVVDIYCYWNVDHGRTQ